MGTFHCALLHLGQVLGSLPKSRGTHSCPHRSHLYPMTVIGTLVREHLRDTVCAQYKRKTLHASRRGLASIGGTSLAERTLPRGDGPRHATLGACRYQPAVLDPSHLLCIMGVAWRASPFVIACRWDQEGRGPLLVCAGTPPRLAVLPGAKGGCR